MTPTSALGGSGSRSMRGCGFPSPLSDPTMWASGSGSGDTRHASVKGTASAREENGRRAVHAPETSTLAAACPSLSLGRRKAYPAALGNVVAPDQENHVTQVRRLPLLLLCWAMHPRRSKPRRILVCYLPRPPTFFPARQGSMIPSVPRRGQRAATACPRSRADDRVTSLWSRCSWAGTGVRLSTPTRRRKKHRDRRDGHPARSRREAPNADLLRE